MLAKKKEKDVIDRMLDQIDFHGNVCTRGWKRILFYSRLCPPGWFGISSPLQRTLCISRSSPSDLLGRKLQRYLCIQLLL